MNNLKQQLVKALAENFADNLMRRYDEDEDFRNQCLERAKSTIQILADSLVGIFENTIGTKIPNALRNLIYSQVQSQVIGIYADPVKRRESFFKGTMIGLDFSEVNKEIQKLNTQLPSSTGLDDGSLDNVTEYLNSLIEELILVQNERNSFFMDSLMLKAANEGFEKAATFEAYSEAIRATFTTAEEYEKHCMIYEDKVVECILRFEEEFKQNTTIGKDLSQSIFTLVQMFKQNFVYGQRENNLIRLREDIRRIYGVDTKKEG